MSPQIGGGLHSPVDDSVVFVIFDSRMSPVVLEFLLSTQLVLYENKSVFRNVEHCSDLLCSLSRRRVIIGINNSWITPNKIQKAIRLPPKQDTEGGHT
jgi:hypothetical protein